MLVIFFPLFPVQIPRLHCLIHRKLAVHDFLQGSPIMEVNYRRSLWISALIFYLILTNLQFNSLLVSLVLPHLTFLTFNLSFFQPKPHFVKEIREALFRHLTAVLGNDEVAAHFMLLHLLSKVMVPHNYHFIFLCIMLGGSLYYSLIPSQVLFMNSFLKK